MRWDSMVQPVPQNALKLKEYFFSLLPHHTKDKPQTIQNPYTRQPEQVPFCLLSGVPSKYQHGLEKDRISWEILGVSDDVLPLW